ncbi:MAG: hypothetical protein EOP06_09670 [Proteobacteria bacterium]|nr:MAG: hypothetical protein EOP06_09670 [Pseudomonadota bacterium]
MKDIDRHAPENIMDEFLSSWSVIGIEGPGDVKVKLDTYIELRRLMIRHLDMKVEKYQDLVNGVERIPGGGKILKQR